MFPELAIFIWLATNARFNVPRVRCSQEFRYFQGSMFPGFNVPRVQCYQGSMFPGSNVTRVQCSQGSMFPGSNVPRVQCSRGFNVPRVRCSQGPMFPGFDVPPNPDVSRVFVFLSLYCFSEFILFFGVYFVFLSLLFF